MSVRLPRRAVLCSDRRKAEKEDSPLRSVQIKPQETSPDLNLNACLHLCHYNNLWRFERLKCCETICVCADHRTVTKVKCQCSPKNRQLIEFKAGLGFARVCSGCHNVFQSCKLTARACLVPDMWLDAGKQTALTSCISSYSGHL